ncbi:MAG: type II toxin-antitoxin system RelE/ParE family toxin [Candidatus Berkelbacteria bacterium]|nr:type II toxin-antitoxin system RelE/ParE family toxin [Candidatus Berkelbacteria bacterium]
MDQIQKALAKLSDKERKKIKQALEKLFSGDIKGLNIKKLKDRSDIFRLRVGDLRIIYRMNENKISILAISRRNENTYK